MKTYQLESNHKGGLTAELLKKLISWPNVDIVAYTKLHHRRPGQFAGNSHLFEAVAFVAKTSHSSIQGIASYDGDKHEVSVRALQSGALERFSEALVKSLDGTFPNNPTLAFEAAIVAV